jgi:hypothetical protein
MLDIPTKERAALLIIDLEVEKIALHPDQNGQI